MSTFTPTDVVDMSKERDWAALLGMMDWDSTSIVFTKRSLIEFLKYTGTTVDTNFSNIQKLPKYAKFGKLAEGDTQPVQPSTSTDSTLSATSESESGSSTFKPSRRVRTAPGGETHDIFGHYVDDDALSGAPAQPKDVAQAAPAPVQASEAPKTEETSESKPVFRPTRRVREMPGGKDSLAGFL